LWSYDSRLSWSNGCSLNFDADEERSKRVHLGMMTLDCPGGALDETTAHDLQLLIEYCNALGGKCSRIDVYFDDYARLVSFDELVGVATRGDFSHFLDFTYKGGGRRGKGKLRNGVISDEHTYERRRTKTTREEVAFGRRGSRGNGKYLRWYNKELESEGEFKCDRWEVEFTQKKADLVFKKFAATAGDLEAFATLCGSLIAGCVTFVKRTGDKNIDRLDHYIWWEKILAILGQGIAIRVRRKEDSLTGKIEWVTRNVSPSLACLKKVFVSERVFLRWLFDVCRDGEGRQNKFTQRLADDNEAILDYEKGRLLTSTGVPYECRVS
jgi:DNA relaxase NicK